jgi:monooxygenase
MAIEHVDVLVIGAGISGISAAWHLQRYCRGLSYAIVEAREELGGTWSVFRYPGIRSDSDMFTLGFSFKPWTQPKSIADGAAILAYLRETASQYGIDRHIRLGQRITKASWSSRDSRWTVDIEQGPDRRALRMTCGFLLSCSGYYDARRGYMPAFADAEVFSGRIVHPQQWPQDLECRDKRIVVIGSGATAMSLVPALAQSAAHVTMVQRSPTYVVARPSVDPIAQKLRRWLPERLAYAATRWKNVLLRLYVWRLCKRDPERVRKMLLQGVRAALGPDYDVDKHFSPRYRPWDQRLCLLADGDLFRAVRSGRAEVVTGDIERFTQRGIRMNSGEEVPADIIVAATGLQLQFLGGMEVAIDGERVDMTKTVAYRGAMYSGIPNFASTFGYVNESWTMKADLVSRYVCRILNHMRRTGSTQCVPRLSDPTVEPQPWMELSSGYFQRDAHLFPHHGSKVPWRLHQIYPRDLMMLRFGRLEDGSLEFSRPPESGLGGVAPAR